MLVFSQNVSYMNNEKNYQKEYIDTSTEFRIGKSKESTGKLYDLLYQMEKIDRTKSEDQILSNIYSLLGFHQSAYEVFKPTVDIRNRKETAKLYTLKEKAASHGNNFIIKDIRNFRIINEQTNLLPENFNVDKEEGNKFVTKEIIVIFNKIVEPNNFEIWIYGNHKFTDNATKIIEYISWLGDCKNELIKFYNSEMGEYTEETADEDWFDTLEIYCARVYVEKSGKLSAEISIGDDFLPDHILDIEIEEREIAEISING